MTTIHHQIKHFHTGNVLFQCELTDQESSLATRHALERAVAGKINLRGADLRGADLSGADLSGGQKLIGERPLVQIGPIGSRHDFLLAFLTTAGVVLKAGCFTGSVDEFVAKLNSEHGDNNHGKEYRAALEMIATHAEIWTPKGEQE